MGGLVGRRSFSGHTLSVGRSFVPLEHADRQNILVDSFPILKVFKALNKSTFW